MITLLLKAHIDKYHLWHIRPNSKIVKAVKEKIPRTMEECDICKKHLELDRKYEEWIKELKNTNNSDVSDLEKAHLAQHQQIIRHLDLQKLFSPTIKNLDEIEAEKLIKSTGLNS